MRLRLLVLAPLVLLAACGDPTPSSPTPADPSPDPGATGGAEDDVLVGRTFLGSGLLVDGEEVPVPGSDRLEITFREIDGGVTTLTARGGCNHMSAGYVVRDGRLVTDSVGGTDMGCDPERHRFDDLLVDLLGVSPQFDLAGDELTLRTDGSPSLEARLTDAGVEEPALPLEGPEWALESFIDGDTVSSVPGMASVTMTLRFGRLVVDTGCNGLEGTYEPSGDKLAVTASPTGDRACEQELADLESRLAAALTGELTVEQDRRSLTLLRDDGTGLGFRAADDA